MFRTFLSYSRRRTLNLDKNSIGNVKPAAARGSAMHPCVADRLTHGPASVAALRAKVARPPGSAQEQVWMKVYAKENYRVRFEMPIFSELKILNRFFFDEMLRKQNAIHCYSPIYVYKIIPITMKMLVLMEKSLN